jgi:hypothetical protein
VELEPVRVNARTECSAEKLADSGTERGEYRCGVPSSCAIERYSQRSEGQEQETEDERGVEIRPDDKER